MPQLQMRTTDTTFLLWQENMLSFFNVFVRLIILQPTSKTQLNERRDYLCVLFAAKSPAYKTVPGTRRIPIV